MTDRDVQIGGQIAKLRRLREMSQTDLANKVQLRQQTIAKIEAGTRPLRLSEASDIAAALGAPLSALDASPEVSADDQRARRLAGELQVMQADVIDAFGDLSRVAQLLEGLVKGDVLSSAMAHAAAEALDGFGPGRTAARLAWMVDEKWVEEMPPSLGEPPF